MQSNTWTVSVGEGCEAGAPLGLVLDKQGSKPTIKKISGSVQRSVDGGAKIGAGHELVSVGGVDVSGLDYLAAVDTIRAAKERPVLLTLREPAVQGPSITKLTPAEMEARSKAATAEGMKQLRAAMQAKAAADDGTTTLSSSDDSELSEDGSEECLGRGHEGERAPKRRRRRKDTIRKLELRERRMQLEVVNAQAEKDEAEEAKAKMVAEVVAPVRKVEEELSSLKKTAQRSFQTGGSAELKEQLNAWRQECEAHSKICTEELEKMSGLPTVKSCLASALSAEMAALKGAESRWMGQLRWAEHWEWAKVCSLWVVVAGTAMQLAQHAQAAMAEDPWLNE
eukprot:COSAG04_NODE_167_length_21718_cov_556.193293_10_plen_339_part_00